MSLYEFEQRDAWDFARSRGIEVKQRNDELQFHTCPYCRGGGRGKDKGTFSINLDNGQFKCLRASCGVTGNMITLSKDFDFSLGSEVDSYYERNRQQYRTFKKRKKPIEPKPEAIQYLEKRGISGETAKRYQMTVQKNHANVLVFPFLDQRGDMQFIKYRKTDFDPAKDSNKEWCESGCRPILFGMYQCNGDNKTLVLTEGQLDSLSVAESGIENAVSVPTGAKGFTWFPHCYDWLLNFDTLIVFGDFERGEITLLEDMRWRFQGRIKVVQPEDYQGCKDANEILQKFGARKVYDAVKNAREIPVQQVKDLSEVKSVDLFSMPKIATGIKSVDQVLSGGIYLGQTVILTGKRGDGKSTFASQILANALEAERNVFAYSGELPDYFFKRWLDMQVAGKHHVIDREQPEGGVSYYITKTTEEKISHWYKGRAFLYDNQAAEDNELNDLLKILEKAIVQYNIELVLLDNLMTALDVGMSVDLYRAQSKFVDKLVKMAKRLQVGVILVVHPRKNKFGADDTDEVAGSSDITNKVDLVMTYKRKKDLLEDERMLSISKNRLTGRLAVGGKEIKLYYDRASKRISDAATMFEVAYSWEKGNDGFSDVTDQMTIPFE